LTGIPSNESFPEQVLDFFDATTVHPDARGFQLAVYDARGKRALFIPWGGYVDKPLGVLLAYHTDQDFSAATSYEAVDLTALLGPAAEGFAGGFLDETGDWLYLVPFRQDTGAGVEPNGLAIRFNLSRNLSDRAAYETFDLATLPSPPRRFGWATGAFAQGFAYYVPVVEAPVPYQPNGTLLRYNAARAFSDPTAWEWYNLVSHVHRQAWGFQSNAVERPWLYLVPYGVGNSVIVRYNVTRPFQTPASYEAFDLATLNPDARGFTGAVVVGKHVVLIPWRDRSQPARRSSMSVAAAYDTRKALSDPAAWAFLDLRKVHPRASGYQFGWVDQEGFVHFVPTSTFTGGGPPPFVVWDSRRPFNRTSSWTSYPSTGVPPSTGAAYDGVCAYLAPYGTNGNSGLITRVRTLQTRK
jgi:hypothetical protein